MKPRAFLGAVTEVQKLASRIKPTGTVGDVAQLAARHAAKAAEYSGEDRAESIKLAAALLLIALSKHDAEAPK